MVDRNTIDGIFKYHKIGLVKSIEEIEIGFSNKVFSINGDYILKICKDKSNEERFEKEVYFFKYFKNKIPIPDVRIYDTSKRLINYDYTIYPKIKGVNLYSNWHILEDVDRRKIVKRICEILKVINSSSIKEFIERYNLKSKFSWRDKIVKKIEKSISALERKRILSEKQIKSIKKYVANNVYVLEEQVVGFVYWDIHFDNVIVKENELVGILDFERTELCSIDYVLDIVKRMVEYPKKYVSAENEQFVKEVDYKNLMIWYKEFYPELFDFKWLERRLDLYSIEQNLSTLVLWPDDNKLLEIIDRIVGAA